MTAILKTEGLTKHFGGVHAVQDFSIEVRQGEVYAIIGPNGAGKTTVLNLMTSLLPVTGGRVLFKETGITGLPPHVITSMGIARTYQNGRLFRRLSVLENVLVGGNCRLRAGWFDVLLNTRRLRQEQEELRERSLSVLAELDLKGASDRPVTALSYGQQRMVEFARALVSQPQVLLLDEPAAGLNSAEVDELLSLLRKLKQQLTIVLVEHNMQLVMRLADRIVVMNFGEEIAEGTPHEVQSNNAVLEAYLGRGYQHVAM